MMNGDVDSTKQAAAFGIKICVLEKWLSGSETPNSEFRMTTTLEAIKKSH
jgi:hypothetical protein